MIKIIQITDIHMLSSEDADLYGVNPFLLLNKAIEKIRQIEDIDCLIITGDIANRGEYDAYIIVNNLFSKLNCPIYWLQGNHDLSEVMLQVSNKVSIKSDKSFIIKNTKFILLQSVMRDEGDLSSNKARGYLFDYEMTFLKRELEENDFENCIIALHHPPVLSNSWADRRILDNRLEFISLIEKFPKVKGVLYGHQHIAQHTIVNDINYICSPPTSFHFDPNGARFSILKNKQGFGIVNIDNSSNIQCEFLYLE